MRIEVSFHADPGDPDEWQHMEGRRIRLPDVDTWTLGIPGAGGKGLFTFGSSGAAPEWAEDALPVMAADEIRAYVRSRDGDVQKALGRT